MRTDSRRVVCGVVIKDGWVFHADLRGFKRRFSEIFRWRGLAGYMEISMCLTLEKKSLEGIRAISGDGFSSWSV